MSASVLTYRTYPTKRPRRTREEVAKIEAAIYDVAQEEQPVTVRRLFYALESRGLIAKTDGEYKQTICRLCGLMRESGDLPFDWIADSSRWMRKPDTYSSVTEAIENIAQFYRRDLWASAPVYVEIWCEKEGLAGALYPVTEEYDVPLMVTKGYSPKTFAWDAAQTFKTVFKPVYVYHLSDLDPSGVDIGRDLEAKLRRYAGTGVELYFERIALTREQVTEYDLPTRPTKRGDSTKRGDPRAAAFEGDSVELDAMPVPLLRDLVREKIEQHVDQRRLEVVRTAEESERSLLGWVCRKTQRMLETNDVEGEAQEGTRVTFDDCEIEDGGADDEEEGDDQ